MERFLCALKFFNNTKLPEQVENFSLNPQISLPDFCVFQTKSPLECVWIDHCIPSINLVPSNLSKSDPRQRQTPQLWPGSKCWMRASGANIQHAATKDTAEESAAAWGRLSNCTNNIIDKMQWKNQKHSNLGPEAYKKSF